MRLRRATLDDRLARRLDGTALAGDLVDELTVCTERQDAAWMLEVWADANSQRPLVVAEG